MSQTRKCKVTCTSTSHAPRKRYCCNLLCVTTPHTRIQCHAQVPPPFSPPYREGYHIPSRHPKYIHTPPLAAWLADFRTTEQADSKLPGVVHVAPGLSHSVHPDFYRNELSGSTERLGGTAIDAYLVEHPEHHLALKLGLAGEDASTAGDGDATSPPSQARLDEARGSFYEEMTTLFQAMEGQVAEGGGTYGVSSLGLSLPKLDPMHVSWEKLVECAEQAAFRAGRDR